ncbi:MAG: hypothetical protein KQH59_05265 [Desulfobulbaceae bacterium]|nr:hypothetical protein [Desulfobulbaceae bacterium]
MKFLSGTARTFEQFFRDQGMSKSCALKMVHDMKQSGRFHVRDGRNSLLHKVAALLRRTKKTAGRLPDDTRDGSADGTGNR